ncbi:MAG: radical SAM protein [Synergistaceae bacterium]|nr:radical SAM protein [Candidatus Equadaptatus faecalis]
MKKFPFFLPFAACPGRCVYCNQNKITGADKIPDAAFVRSAFAELKEPREVCFFGGSFLRFPYETVKKYLDAATEAAPQGSTIRFSTYPNDLDSEDVCLLLKKYPVSRIELGIQSLDENVLHACKRDLRPDALLKSVAGAAEKGFPLGVQLMIGLPSQTVESSLDDLKRLAEIKSSEVWDLRIYPCLVIEGTELASMLQAGTYKPLSVNEAVEWGGRLLAEAEELNFNVIRVGLQETEALAASVLGGPHHPALGELIMADAAVRRLLKTAPDGPWTEDAKNISKFTGHDNFGYRLLAERSGKSCDEVRRLLSFAAAEKKN